MCIRITKELKDVYEGNLKIDLASKIQYPLFVKILTILGYLDSKNLPDSPSLDLHHGSNGLV